MIENFQAFKTHTNVSDFARKKNFRRSNDFHLPTSIYPTQNYVKIKRFRAFPMAVAAAAILLLIQLSNAKFCASSNLTILIQAIFIASSNKIK